MPLPFYSEMSGMRRRIGRLDSVSIKFLRWPIGRHEIGSPHYVTAHSHTQDTGPIDLRFVGSVGCLTISTANPAMAIKDRGSATRSEAAKQYLKWAISCHMFNRILETGPSVVYGQRIRRSL